MAEGRTPHGRALNEAVSNGPIARSELLRAIMPAVPTGMAIEAAHKVRHWKRQNSGYASDVPADEISPRYVKQAKSDVYIGARRIAHITIYNRLKNGTLIINRDGLIQHRDWKPQ